MIHNVQPNHCTGTKIEPAVISIMGKDTVPVTPMFPKENGSIHYPRYEALVLLN